MRRKERVLKEKEDLLGIHIGEIALHVGEEDGGFDDLVEGRAGRLEDGA